MVSKKIVALFAIVAILGAALLFSQGNAQPTGERLVLYNGFAYYTADTKVSGPDASFDLPAGIERDSVRLKLATGYVVSQYIKEANQTSESDLLKSYVGKEVSVFDENGKEVKGTLLKFDGKAYVKSGADLYIITPSYYQLPGFNSSVVDENESVVFRISQGQSDAQLSYLLDSISWSPAYTLYLDGNGGTLSLYGNVDNSAKDYQNVSLTLFYGEVRKSSSYPYYYYSNAYGSALSEKSAPSGAPSYTPGAASEYYKFELGQVQLRSGTSAFNLFEKQVVAVKKTYELGISGYDSSQALPIILRANNSAQNGLGVAIPAGKIRVIDSAGFVGEDTLAETPKNEQLEFTIGNAFDVLGSSKITNTTNDEYVNCAYRGITASNAQLCGKDAAIYVSTNSYEATVKNKKSEPADVVLYYSPYGEWVVENESMPSVKVSQSRIEWRFTVPANSEQAISFTIRSKTQGYGVMTPPVYSGGVATTQ